VHSRLSVARKIEMTATVVLRIGPLKATFGGKVTLSDLDPPNSYRISGEGSGASPASPRAALPSFSAKKVPM
jgi:carbon monoxide dehydrogenase subunit G